jgi:hypothetical protein
MVHRAKTDQHDLFYGPSYPVQLTDYEISLLFCPYNCNQPTTCNITNHVICLVVRSRLFKLPQACKTLTVSLVFCSPFHYHTKMYFITINVQYVRYSTGRKIKYFIVIVKTNEEFRGIQGDQGIFYPKSTKGQRRTN